MTTLTVLVLVALALVAGYCWGHRDAQHEARLARWRDAKEQLERDGFVLSFIPHTAEEYEEMWEASSSWRDRRAVERLIEETK